MRADRRQDDVLQHAQVREQVEGLEHEPEPAADLDRVAVRVGDHPPVEQDVAVVDVVEQVDAAQQRRLAGAGGADQRDRLVLADLEVDPAQHLGLAVGLGDALDLEHDLAHAGATSGPRARRVPACIRSTIRASGTVTHRYSSAAASSGV